MLDVPSLYSVSLSASSHSQCSGTHFIFKVLLQGLHRLEMYLNIQDCLESP